MAGRITLESMLLRDFVVVPDERTVNYLLVKIVPTQEGTVQAMPMNVALVLDVSGSMYDERRLENVQAAAAKAVDLLRPTDIVSVVAFAETAVSALPATTATNPNQIKDCIARIGNCGVDPSGTSMHLGMAEGVRQVKANFSQGRINRVVVLTDGQTKGEDICHQIARTETARGITFSTIGVGHDWNENLLKALVDVGKGRWYFVDSPAKALEVFDSEFAQLATTAFANVALSAKCTKDVLPKKARQVLPECADASFRTVAEREFVVDLHTMCNDEKKVVILDLSLPKRADGQYLLATLNCTYDVPAERICGESALPVEVRVTYTSDPQASYVNGEVARYIDELQTFDMANKIQTALAQGDRRRATMLAQNMQRTATRLGPAGAKKTQLANQVLGEIESGGNLSRKTQLALQDGARKTQLAPDQ